MVYDIVQWPEASPDSFWLYHMLQHIVCLVRHDRDCLPDQYAHRGWRE